MIRVKFARFLMWYASKIAALATWLAWTGSQAVSRQMTKGMAAALLAQLRRPTASDNKDPTASDKGDPAVSDPLYWPEDPTEN